MPQIIVAADRGAAFGDGAVTFRERVNVADFESAHFAAQLVERLGWAVEDAEIVERTRDAAPEETAEDTRLDERRRHQTDDDAHEAPRELGEHDEPVEERPARIHAPA